MVWGRWYRSTLGSYDDGDKSAPSGRDNAGMMASVHVQNAYKPGTGNFRRRENILNKSA